MNKLTFFFSVILMFSLVLGCAGPTDIENGKFPAHTPEELTANLKQGYDEENLQSYLSSFSEDCRFLSGGNYLWGKTDEQKIHQRLFAAAKSIELKITEALNEEQTETSRRSLYHYYLEVQLASERMLEAQGMVELGLAKNSAGNWQINSFGELNTGLQKPAPVSKTKATNHEVDYFPLQVGNRWIYEEQFAPNTDDIDILVTDSLMIRGSLYYQAEPFWYLFPISASFARQDSLNQLRLFVEDDSTERVIFNLAAGIGDSLIYYQPFTNGEMVVELISYRDSLKVPAGTFKDVLEFLVTDNISGSRYLHEFAADVGLIRQRGTNQVMALKSAFVNGRKYPFVVGVENPQFSWTEIKTNFYQPR